LRTEPKPYSTRLLWLAALALVTLLGRDTSLAAPARPAAPSSRLSSVYLVPVQRAAGNVSSLIPRRITARLRVDLAAQQDIELLAALGDFTGGGSLSVYQSGAKPEPDKRKAAKRALAAGLAAYKARRWADAQRHLLAALKDFEISAAHIQDGDRLGQIFGYLGLAFLRQGKKHLAMDAIETAYAINPTLKLEKLPLPRRLRRVVLRAGRRALRRRKARVTVKVEPAGAWVFLDGDEKGKAPFVIKGVLPGRHYIAARLKGRHSRSVVINIKPGTRPTITLKLPDATPQLKTGKGLAHAFLAEIQKRLGAGLVDKHVKPLAAQFARRVKADFLLLGAVSRARQGGYFLRSYLFRRADAKLVELDSYRFDGELLNLATGTSKVADAAANATSSFPAKRDITYVSVPRLGPTHGGRGGSGGLVGVVPGGERKVHSTAKPWYLRWTFWGTVIGVVVVGAIATGSYGLYKVTHRESKGYQITVNVP
jgi:tetratricopeptide (TPR) repeat protein